MEPATATEPAAAEAKTITGAVGAQGVSHPSGF